MATNILMPALSPTMTDGTLSRWLKKDGEAVRQDEPVCELETEKATTEVPAPASGTLRIAVQSGQSVTIGAVIGRIEEGAASPTPPYTRRVSMGSGSLRRRCAVVGAGLLGLAKAKLSGGDRLDAVGRQQLAHLGELAGIVRCDDDAAFELSTHGAYATAIF